MSLVKKCRHARGLVGAARLRAWQACGCQWTADLTISGIRTYRALGTDYTRARREHARLTTALADGRIPDNPTPTATFRHVADRYWLAAEHVLAPNTRSSYRSSLHHATSALGAIDVRDVTSADLDDMEARLLHAGYAPGTVKLVRVAAAQVMRRAVSEGLIMEAPRPTLRHARVHDEPAAFTPAEITGILRHLVGVAHAATRFTYLTGLRPGETIAVERRDVTGTVLHVERSRIQRTGGVGPTKGRLRRPVDLSPDALTCLADAAGDDRVFPMGYTAWLRQWHDALTLAGHERCGLHALRHSNVALRLIAGQPITYVARQLGHSSGAFTLRRYGRWVPSERDDAAALDRAARHGHPTSR